MAVTGCDTDLRGAADVGRAGVQLWQGQDAGHVEGARAGGYTAAGPPDHPELGAARALGLAGIRGAEALQFAGGQGRGGGGRRRPRNRAPPPAGLGPPPAPPGGRPWGVGARPGPHPAAPSSSPSASQWLTRISSRPR